MLRGWSLSPNFAGIRLAVRRLLNLTDNTLITAGALPSLPPGFTDAAARLAAYSRFRPALARYCQDVATAAPTIWPLYKMFDQLGRYLVAYMLIHNYFAWKYAGAAPPTLSALQKAIGAGASARHTAGFVAALKAGHFVMAEPDPDDRRLKFLKPAPSMIIAIGRSVRLFVAAVDEIEGRHPGRAAGLADPERLGLLLYRSAQFVRANGTLIHPFQRIVHFAGRDCGYPLLAAIMGAHYARTLPDAPPAALLSYKALARRLQVSPAHVGNLLGEAEQRGWFVIGEGRRLTMLCDELLAEFEQWAAWQMVHFDSLAVAPAPSAAMGGA
ncbi:hypothetical protein C7450_11773 [Chelatococcus asaccharovorans]|uniref:Uncharacterized protein n=1 Tax=Chelatococcus asaccharovorans TaxID=28210 RepID=A0A2V3U4I3_9HYPH|nr:hypothetical protein C7450_11773 [Chelatococcus asaccharovorans]